MRKGMRVEESSHVVHPTSTVRVWWYCQWITGMNTLCVYNSCFCPSSPYTVTVVDLPFMKPNCSPLHIMFTVSRRWCSSTLSYIFMLYVAQWAYVSVISTAHAWCPLVLKQDASSPFITHQSSSAPFNDFVKVSEFCRTSLQLVPRQSRHFQASAGKLSDPTAFPFFIFPSALSTSSDDILQPQLSTVSILAPVFFLLGSPHSWVSESSPVICPRSYLSAYLSSSYPSTLQVSSAPSWSSVLQPSPYLHTAGHYRPLRLQQRLFMACFFFLSSIKLASLFSLSSAFLQLSSLGCFAGLSHPIIMIVSFSCLVFPDFLTK